MAPGKSSKGRELLIERFVAEYLIDLNGTRAYLVASGGRVKERTATVEASKLLTNPDVQKRLAEGKKRQLASAELSAQRVLEELRRIAFLDPATLFDEAGRLKSIHEMSPEARASIMSIEQAQANFDKTDGKKSDEWLHKVKITPKTPALVALAKHFKLITEVIEDRTPVDWDKRVARLRAARKRAGEKV